MSGAGVTDRFRRYRQNVKLQKRCFRARQIAADLEVLLEETKHLKKTIGERTHEEVEAALDALLSDVEFWRKVFHLLDSATRSGMGDP